MNYIVLDMEWNQPYSKEKKKSRGVEVFGEIIQLGAVKLDEKFNVLGRFKRNVRPVFYKKINSHVRKITGLTYSLLKDGYDFADALEELFRFCGDEFKFMTWGCDDMPMLKNNMLAHGLDISLIPENINLQVIFNIEVSHDARQWSLEDAMEQLDIEQNLRAHDALSDAVNTTKIAQCLHIEKTVAKYARLAFIENGMDRELTDGFHSLREVFGDKRFSIMRCPVCGKRLKRTEWIRSRYKKYTVTDCKRHGTFKIKLTAMRTDDGYSALRSIAYASPEAVKRYNESLVTVE